MKSMILFSLSTIWALEPAVTPPHFIAKEETPVFIVVGSDDNHGYMDWLNGVFMSRKHADGSSLHMTYYSNMSESDEWMNEHIKAYESGSEIAMHTYSHPDLSNMNQTEIKEQIQLNQEDLSLILSLDAANIKGFRTPFLSVTDSVFSVLSDLKIKYDCSLEEGFQADRNAQNMYWPYTMDHSSQSSAWAAQQKLGIGVKNHQLTDHPGLWEIPVYAWEIPQGKVAESYGLDTAFCDTMSARAIQSNNAAAEPKHLGCKVTGFDWNQWFQYGLSGPEYTAILKYNLDQRIAGNHAPLTIGMHPNYYSDTEAEKRKALEDFVDYALTKKDVRFVSGIELVNWMETGKTTPVNTTKYQGLISNEYWNALGQKSPKASGVNIYHNSIEIKK